MLRRQGYLEILEELRTNGEQIPVEHDDQDRIRGGLLRSGTEEQPEDLDKDGKEGGEGRNAGNARREPAESLQGTGPRTVQKRRLRADTPNGPIPQSPQSGERHPERRGEEEYYINEFDDVAAELVRMRRLTRYDRMVLFLEGLPVRIAGKVYEWVKLDTKKLETFERSGVFNEVVEAALNDNRADADFDRLGLCAKQEPQAKETISAILKRPEWKPPTPANAEATPPTQAPPMRPNAGEDVMVGLLEEMRDLRIYVQQRWVEQEGQSPNQVAREAPFAAAAGPMTGMNESMCFWCENEGHIKTRCPDYQNSLANRTIHFQGAHPRTRLGSEGCGGPIVPLPKESGLWQQVWVDRERRKPESAMQQHGRIEEVPEVSMGPETTPAGKLRQLRLEETKTHR